MSLYGTEVIEAHWPMDGPHTPERIEAAGVALEELVRYLNRATQPQTGGLTTAPHGAGLVRSLVTAAHRQMQLCQQLASWAHTVAADPTIRHDYDRDDAVWSHRLAAAAAMEAASELVFAVDVAEELANHYSRVQRRLDALSHTNTGGGQP